MQEPCNSVFACLATGFFVKNALITLFLTAGANFVVDFYLNTTDPYYMWSLTFVFNVAITGAIMAFLIVISQTGSVRNEIINGRAVPIYREALRNGGWIFFPLAVTDWKKRLPMFIVMTWAYPGFLTIVLTTIYCDLNNDFTFSWTDESCPVKHLNMCFYNMIWKSCMVMMIMPLNFIAAHNMEQPELMAENRALLPWNRGGQELNRGTSKA